MIKSRIIIFGLIWAIGHRAVAQPCKKITIDDVTQKKILANYIDDAVKKGAFVGDKGVVEVIRYLNENGRPSWLIKTAIDDSYKDNPPVEWASLDSDVILFYDAKATGSDVVKRAATPELLRCLDDAIKDRLYIRPPRRERLVDSGFTTPTGKPIIIKTRRFFRSNSLIIVFEADGSISKFHPV